MNFEYYSQILNQNMRYIEEIESKKSELNKIKSLSELSPEPFSPQFNTSWLKEKLLGRKAPLKTLLLDQRICAGVGNIYADEACYLARLLPTRPAGSLDQKEIFRLVRSIKKVLRSAIKDMGTTIRNYKTTSEEPGDYQPKVYGREGEPCPRCGKRIVRVVKGGRSSYFCPGCQK